MPQHEGHRIASVAPGSIAAELGLEAGDILLAIDGRPVIDRIDYEMFCAEESLRLTVRDHRSGQESVCEVEKDSFEDLGLAFDDYLMSPQRSCANRCPFCFVDQLPGGLRESLYVKDDDWRMSFLAGNFVTLTNVPDVELARIVERRVSPLFVSVQATEPALRNELLGNDRAGRIMHQLRTLADAGLRFHAQFVLCRGRNDGQALERSIEDLIALFPAPISAAVVPVGLTQHRKGLADVQPYDCASANALLDQIERWQERCLRDLGTVLIHAADEFYILADRPYPSAERYEGYPQIENGVGMLRKFEDELDEAIAEGFVPPGRASGQRFLIATGRSAEHWLRKQAARAAAHTGAAADVIGIDNDFFGRSVTVAGLLAGCDLLRSLRQKALSDYAAVLIPDTMLREGEDVFLDGMTLADLQVQLPIPIRAIPTLGESFLQALSG